ncbi:MAG: prolyl oligopeptidase family serine peptidase [Saprospiraceae bacterium]|nr:prolyl oligopeptidase family serine peptidase [Saprospiraceae bacterium]
MRIIYLLVGSLLGFYMTDAQSELDLDEIMQGHDFAGYSPTSVRWSPNSQDIYFRWNPDNQMLASLYKSNSQAIAPIQVKIAEERQQVRMTDRTKDGKRYLGTRNGDVVMGDLETDDLLLITNTVARESNPIFSGDENEVIYQVGDNLFSWSIADGATSQLTNFKKGSAPIEDKPEAAQKKWLKHDQLEYFEILNERAAMDDLREERSDLLEPSRPKAVYLGKNRMSALRIEPSKRFVFYRLTPAASSNDGTKVPNFVTESGYLQDIRARPKVGSAPYKSSGWLLDLQRDTVIEIKVDSLTQVRQKAPFLAEYHQQDTAWSPLLKRAKPTIIHPPIFSESADHAVVVVRSLDNKDRWIAQLNLATGVLSDMDHQHDPAWIGGPGISSWNFSNGSLGWLDNRTIWFQSEATGYSHLYRLDINSGKKKALTSGRFEIQSAELSHDGSTFYITSNAKHPGEQHFYHLSSEGGEMKRITTLEGAHQVSISPDETQLAIRYSNSTTPWELYVMPNQVAGKVQQITQSQSDAFQQYPWRTPKLISFTASDGTAVPARLYEPEGGAQGKPAVIFVHGAGYLQNAHKWWSSYFREYMFHNYLADHGYAVLDIDYRGSAGYGRDWRTAIYRHMGGKDLSDQVDGAKYLSDVLGVDDQRIGIYGGSYGGFITLMALFTSPHTFACGAALRSVTDWAHYNHGYTSNILNTPVQDSIAYRRSSPIYHAEGLQKPLLMLHGMVDSNVQFQDVVRLSQRLIELKKEEWDLAVYPMEGHGFREASSWSDEYRRIFKLFETHLK